MNVDIEDRTPTGIMTNLELCDGTGQLRNWLGSLTMAEVVSLGLDQGRFVLVRATGDRSLKAIEKQTIVLPPEGIAEVPILLEAVLTLGGVTVVVVSGDAHPQNPLLLDLVDEAKRLIPSSQTHLVLQTWRRPSSQIFIQRSSDTPFVELSPGGLYDHPRLISMGGGRVGLLVFTGPILYFFLNIVESHRPAPVRYFDSKVIGVSRVTPRSIGGIDFVVTTEEGIERVLFRTASVMAGSIQRVEPTGFAMQGTISNGDRPLVVASDPEGNLVLGEPGHGFVPGVIAR